MAEREEDRRARGAWYTPPALALPLAERALAGVSPGALVVDLACGDGALLEAASRLGDYRLVGFDISSDAIDAARARVPAGEFRVADGLRAEVAGPQVILGNPPFLFGAQRPVMDVAGFELAAGQWDTAWLFLERALRLLGPGGRLGFVLPDSVLARVETARVRRFVQSRVSRLQIRHDEPSFSGAHVATVLLSAVVGPGDTQLEMDAARYSLPADCTWPPAPHVPTDWVRLGDVLDISRGEEIGKRSLARASAGAEEGLVGIVAGEGVEPLGQPRVTHVVAHGALRKPEERYASPKVVVVKTGASVQAGVDLHGLRTLQSVYNLRLRWPQVDPELACWFLCGLLVSEEVQRRFIHPSTGGKKLFPQITMSLLRDVRFPAPSPTTIAAIAGAAEAGDRERLDRVVRAWMEPER